MIPQAYADADISGVSIVSATALFDPQLLSVYFNGGWFARFGEGFPVNMPDSGLYVVESIDCQMVELAVDFNQLIGGETTLYPFNPQIDSFPNVGTGQSPLSSLVFEDIARKIYGNPNMGILLRQLNIIDEGAGAAYVIPAADELSKEEITPESHIFKSREDLEHIFEEKLW